MGVKKINFVMSTNTQSGIFNAIIKYFFEYLPSDFELIVSEHPLENADIYHYHRPNLEKSLLPNSIVTVHHDLEDTDPWFNKDTYIERYKQAHTVVCLNQTQKKILKEDYDFENIVVIPHGINKTLFDNIKKLKNEKLTIGIVSKYYHRRVKGEALLYELFKRLDKEKISFIFVGEGRSQTYTDAVAYGFDAQVYEYLPYILFNELYRNLDILLVPSLFEGGPANLPEALYTKTPVIGRKIAMIADMIKEGENGYFLTGDSQKDADMLNSFASYNQTYTVLQENIKNSFPNVLDWKDIVLSYVDVYNQVLQGK